MSNQTSLPIATEQFGVIRDQFSFENKPLTVVTIDGEPWFIAKELSAHLGVENAVRYAKEKHKRVLRKVDFENKANTHQVLALFESTVSSISVVSEAGLYSLAMRGRTAEAERFSDWVTEDVLPSIRKTGKYELPQAQTQSNDIAETSAVNEIKALKELIEIRAKEHEEDISYLMDVTSTLTRQMDIVAFTGNRAGPTPGARPQICMDYARRKILSGCLDKLLIHKDAKRQIYLLVLNELTDVFPQYRDYADSELIHPAYIDKFIKERVKIIDSFFSDSLD